MRFISVASQRTVAFKMSPTWSAKSPWAPDEATRAKIGRPCEATLPKVGLARGCAIASRLS